MLNELITENKHFVESKGVDSYKHKGHYKIWLSSNEAVPIKLSPRDRRYFVTKIHTTKEIIFKKDPDYFKKLWAFIEDPNALANYIGIINLLIKSMMKCLTLKCH